MKGLQIGRSSAYSAGDDTGSLPHPIRPAPSSSADLDARPTAVIFGLTHASNLIGKGAKAFLQVLATATAGYFFLIRRSWGGLLVPSVVHELWISA